MLQEEILDFDLPQKVKAIRWPIMLLEFLPFISTIIVGVTRKDPFIIVLVFPIMSLIYFLFGWTIFKGQKYEKVEIITAEVTSLYLVVCSLAYLYSTLSWPFGLEFTYFSLFSGVLIDLYLIRHYLINRKKALEYRFSIKLLSRVFIYQLLLIHALINVW